MEIWTAEDKNGKLRWKKRPFRKKTAGKLPLMNVLDNHLSSERKDQHWIVFSHEEEKKLKATMSRLVDEGFILTKVLCGLMNVCLGNRWNRNWQVVRLSLDPSKSIVEIINGENYLAIQFNLPA